MLEPTVEPDGPAANSVAVAREIALRQLTVRARTRAELARALARRNVPEATAVLVLERLTEIGLVDDRAFARDWFAGGRRRNKSQRALAAELAEKGVAKAIIAECASEFDPDTDYQVAKEFALKKAPSLAQCDRQVQFRRLSAALARRGFSSAVVLSVTKEVLAGSEGEFWVAEYPNQAYPAGGYVHEPT